MARGGRGCCRRELARTTEQQQQVDSRPRRMARQQLCDSGVRDSGMLDVGVRWWAGAGGSWPGQQKQQQVDS